MSKHQKTINGEIIMENKVYAYFKFYHSCGDKVIKRSYSKQHIVDLFENMLKETEDERSEIAAENFQQLDYHIVLGDGYSDDVKTESIKQRLQQIKNNERVGNFAEEFTLAVSCKSKQDAKLYFVELEEQFGDNDEDEDEDW